MWETLTQQRGCVWETLTQLLRGSGTQGSVFTPGWKAGAGARGRGAETLGASRARVRTRRFFVSTLLFTPRHFADTCREREAGLCKWQGHQWSHMRPGSVKMTMLRKCVPSYFVRLAGNRLPVNAHAAVPTVPNRTSTWMVPSMRCSWLLPSTSDSVGWAGATWTLDHTGISTELSGGATPWAWPGHCPVPPGSCSYCRHS